MPKARKIIRCLIAFAFALAFAVNSVFASYSDASGYYSCLGGGWNFSSSTGNVTSPSSASGTYQLSTLSVLSGIFKNTQAISTTNSRLQTIYNDTSSIRTNTQSINNRFSAFSSDFSKFAFSDYDASYVSPKSSYLYQIEHRLGVQNGLFFNGVYTYDDGSQLTLASLLENYPDSYASQLLNSVLDPTERAIRDASDDAANSVIDENNGYYGSGRVGDTVSSISSVSSFADNLDFFRLNTDASDFSRIFTPAEEGNSLLSFFTRACFIDMNKTITLPDESFSSVSVMKNSRRLSPDVRRSRSDEVNKLIFATMSPDDPRLQEALENVR